MDEKNNDNRQVLVIQNEEEVRPSKWTWAKYGKSIAKYKWWVLGSTVALGLAGFLLIQFGYNPSKVTFKSEFSYNLAMSEDGDGNGTFVDGTVFNYYDIVSRDNLLAVKETSSDFSGINVNSVVKNNEISIGVNGYTDSATNKFVVSTPITYTLSGKLSSFGDQDTATKFIQALIDSTKTKAETAIQNYSISSLFPADSVYEDLDFEYQISLLSKQYDQIKSSLEGLYKTAGGTSDVVKGNKDQTLASIISDYELSYQQGAGTVFTALDSKLESKKYVNYDVDDVQSSIDTLTELGETDIESLKSTLQNIDIYEERLNKINQAVLAGDSAAANQAASYNAKILELTLQMNDYTKELKTLGYVVPDPVTLDNLNTITLTGEGKIQMLEAVKSGSDEGKAWAASCASFKKSIAEVKKQLVEDTATGSEVYRYVNLNYRDSVHYSYPGVIDTSGSLSPWIGVGVGAVVGFLASSLVCCVVYISKEDKEKANAVPEKE